MNYEIPASPEEIREVLTPAQMWRRINKDKVDIGKLFTLTDKNGIPVKKTEDRNGVPTAVTYTCIFVKKQDLPLQMAIYPTRGNIVEPTEDHSFIEREKALIDKTVAFGGEGFIPSPRILPDEPDMSELDAGESFEGLEHIEAMEQTPSQPVTESAPKADETPERPRAMRITDMDPTEREKLEKKDTIRAFLKATSELIDPNAFTSDPKKKRAATEFLGEAVSRFNSLGIDGARIDSVGKSGFEKTDPRKKGVTLSRLRRSARRENVAGDPDDPSNVVDALVINVFHGALLVGPDETVPDMVEVGRQINTIAALRFQLECINRGENTPFLQLLKEKGIKEIEIKVGSWRYRTIDLNGKPVDSYCIAAPLIGSDLTTK